MVQHALHEEAFLSVCKYYRAIYDTPNVKRDESKWIPVLQNVILFAVLASFDNEQSDLIHRIYEDPNVSKLVVYKEFAKCFLTTELMRWPKIEEIYGDSLKGTFVFDVKSENGNKRLKQLHKRVIEHNIRVISKYYTKITLKRLTQLLDLPSKETEEFLSNLVTSKMIYARIDRPAGVVSFETRKEANAILNDWASNINQLLELIVKTVRDKPCMLKSRTLIFSNSDSSDHQGGDGPFDHQVVVMRERLQGTSEDRRNTTKNSCNNKRVLSYV
ncbi:hypothetical protein HK096_005653 [Nowakowskiella sp. JEL0078]|nr:hypothetical protein HK096_005653 [Nowakowskiella sp. JEL0078]